MAKSSIFNITWAALRLLVLSQITSTVLAEIRLECVRDLADYYRADYEWNVEPFYTWKYAATADRLPSLFQGKIQGTGIFYADGADGTGANSFTRDATEPVPSPTPGYVYIKYYMHRTNASDVYTIVRPAKGVDGFAVTLPTNDDFKWEEQLIQVDIEAANSMGFWIGVMNRNMTEGQYLLVDTIALVQGEIVSTAADAAALCSELPPPPDSLSASGNLKKKASLRSH